MKPVNLIKHYQRQQLTSRLRFYLATVSILLFIFLLSLYLHAWLQHTLLEIIQTKQYKQKHTAFFEQTKPHKNHYLPLIEHLSEKIPNNLRLTEFTTNNNLITISGASNQLAPITQLEQSLMRELETINSCNITLENNVFLLSCTLRKSET